MWCKHFFNLGDFYLLARIVVSNFAQGERKIVDL